MGFKGVYIARTCLPDEIGFPILASPYDRLSSKLVNYLDSKTVTEVLVQLMEILADKLHLRFSVVGWLMFTRQVT